LLITLPFSRIAAPITVREPLHLVPGPVKWREANPQNGRQHRDAKSAQTAHGLGLLGRLLTLGRLPVSCPLWLILRCYFPDVVDEHTLPKLGHSTYRADFGIRSLKLIIEAIRQQR